MTTNSKKSTLTKSLYVAAAVVTIIAIASVVNDIIIFNNTINQFISQGYTSGEVIKQLIPSQLLPGLFEAVAIYGGMAMLLLGAGVINQKVIRCETTVDAVAADDHNDTVGAVVDTIDIDAEQVETVKPDTDVEGKDDVTEK